MPIVLTFSFLVSVRNDIFPEGRGPAKRKVKPIEPQSLLDFDLGEGESSDDSDFRIEDHPEESDDYSINSDEEKSTYFWVYFTL